MSYFRAEKVAIQMMMSGFKHQTREEELVSRNIFQVDRNDLERILSANLTNDLFLRYVDVLGPDRIRAIKNSLICFITCICRIAIDEGVDVEFSYALSDFYINELEHLNTEKKLRELLSEIVIHYYDLTNKSKSLTYSKHIVIAVRFIAKNIYGACPVKTVAEYVKLEPHYFSSLFTSQVGMTPSRYIMCQKLDTAKKMLTTVNSSMTVIAESLGFCDAAHFSRCFKKEFNMTPSAYANHNKSKISPNN